MNDFIFDHLFIDFDLLLRLNIKSLLLIDWNSFIKEFLKIIIVVSFWLFCLSKWFCCSKRFFKSSKLIIDFCERIDRFLLSSLYCKLFWRTKWRFSCLFNKLRSLLTLSKLFWTWRPLCWCFSSKVFIHWNLLLIHNDHFFWIGFYSRNLFLIILNEFA